MDAPNGVSRASKRTTVDPRARRIVHLDLAAGMPPQGLEVADAPVFLVVWWRDLLLGYRQLHRTVTAPELAARLARLIGPSVGRRLLGPGYPTPRPGLTRTHPPAIDSVLRLREPLQALSALPAPSPNGRSVTLAICTLGRPAALERCLSSIAAASDRPDEVLVVDNAPHTAGARTVVEKFPGFRYVPEPRTGLSAARNRAARAAGCDVLAFVDDDVVVHPRWLAPLRRAFDDSEVMAVTGLVLPAELETEAQVAFETSYGGLGLGYERARYDREFVRATVAYGMPVWKLGAGANMAIRRAAFELVGGFDDGLGPVGGAGCGDDSEFWYRLLAEGWACRYEPDSVVFHYHRRETSALESQIREYTRSHVAALFVQFARFRHIGNLRRAFLSLPKYFARRAPRALVRARAARVEAARTAVDTYPWELSGYVRGLRYLPLATAPHPPRHKAPRRGFLARNPYPRPYTLGFFYREKMRAIHRVAPDLPAGEVLEVGGGRSGLARLLYPGAQVTTIDLDPDLADAPVNRDARVRFVTGDATELPFADASFDVVTFFDVLEHIPDDRRAAREALRVLRPGGFVLVSTPSHLWRFPYYRALRPICPTEAEVMAEWGHVRRGYAPAQLAELFGWSPVRTAGFISPLSALAFDIGWSKLPESARRALCGLVSPVTWLAYALHPPSRPGTELAASWRKPDR
jgi:GT2 family glycosyltransferase/SAM-dependent methyltransferase